MTGGKQQEREVILESSLQAFFYDQLQEFNKKSVSPLPNEAIYYSSMVMDKFGLSGEYFEMNDEGKLIEKVLGIKLLESSKLSGQEQKRQLKDVGDTALLVCGFFAESLNKKIIDTKYYQELGQIAYSRLNNMVPSAYDVPRFFEVISHRFDQLTSVMSLVSQKSLNHEWPSSSVYLFVSKKVAG